MPRKWVEERDPSPVARCTRSVDGCAEHWCGAALKLHITQSPIPEYRQLVTQTCLAGHVVRVQGVLERFPEVWAEGDGYGL